MMTKFFYTCLFLLSGFLVHAQTPDTLRVMAYNLLNFPDGRNDCGTNVVVPARWDTLRLLLDYVQPDVLQVCELQSAAGADSILNQALNINGKTSFRRADFVLNQSDFFNKDLNNMIFYDSDKMVLDTQDAIITNTRDLGYYRFWVKDTNLAAHHDTIFIDFYEGHFKASAADSADRQLTCQTLRNHIAATGSTNVIAGGDLNFYSSYESGFQTLTAGANALNDPLNMPGAWTNNPAFAAIHTQSTRITTNPSYDCGAVSGVDDRFDFLLVSDALLNTNNDVFYIANSYQTLGNNGSTYNTRINNPINTSPLPYALLNALFYMSDHLPVYMDIGIRKPTFTLAVQLNQWKGNARKDGNLLRWSVEATLEPNLVFFLERSHNGIDFQPLGSVPFDPLETNFSFLDPTPADLQYYRMHWQKANGVVEYTPIIAIENPFQEPLWFVYPNPTAGMLTLELPTLNGDTEGTIRLFDLCGRTLLDTPFAFRQGVNAIPTASLPDGIYILETRYLSFTHRVKFQKN